MLSCQLYYLFVASVQPKYVANLSKAYKIAMLCVHIYLVTHLSHALKTEDLCHFHQTLEIIQFCSAPQNIFFSSFEWCVWVSYWCCEVPTVGLLEFFSSIIYCVWRSFCVHRYKCNYLATVVVQQSFNYSFLLATTLAFVNRCYSI